MTAPAAPVGPGSYLARDYEDFRQLLLDRLSLTLPDWHERHVPDILVALLEVVAYAADHLSYFQDAVATEAYLGTARQRVSVQRHARLVGYRMHSGCNARTWVVLEVAGDVELALDQTCFITSPRGAGGLDTVLLESALRATPTSAYTVFEPVERGTRSLSALDNCLRIDAARVLPQGATSAVLVPVSGAEADAEAAASSRLAPGRAVVLEQVRDAQDGTPTLAPGARHTVLLTAVERAGAGIRVSWAVDDALPFPLPVAADTGLGYVDDLSVARGNVVLVDHGVSLSKLTRMQPGLGAPVPVTRRTGRGPAVACELATSGITRRAPVGTGSRSAGALLRQDPRDALADTRAITVGHLPAGDNAGDLPSWEVREDLVHSGSGDRHVVVEFDDDDRARLRFGDGVLGAAAPAAAPVHLDLRIGNGSAGDIGPDALAHLVVPEGQPVPAVLRVHNPLPAAGVDPEGSATVRLAAPAALRAEQDRAVTAEDYRTYAARVPGVQAATARVTGTATGYRVDVHVDPLGREVLDASLRDAVATALEERRMVGHRVVVLPPRYVPLEVEVAYTLAGNVATRSGTIAALGRALGSGSTAGGLLGSFHPDRFTFGTPVASSQIVAAAMDVPGVVDARVRVLRIQGRPGPALPAGDVPGVLQVEPDQIVRLDVGGAGSWGRLALVEDARWPR